MAALITEAPVTRIPSIVASAAACTHSESCRPSLVIESDKISMAGRGSGRDDTRLATIAVGYKNMCAIHSGPCVNGPKEVRVHASARTVDARLANQAYELSASSASIST